LPFQIGDLLRGVRDLLRGVGNLLIPFRYLLTEFVNLTLLPLDLPLQIFPTWRMCVQMTTRPCLLAVCAPSGSRIHQPYVKLFREDCPAKSVRILELPQKQGREQMQKKALRRNPTACPKRHRFLRKGSLGSLGG
jgi:hypothetical protein